MALTKATYSMIEGAPVNVLDYGADPTGTTDSTSAINNAIAAGNNIYIPQGTYNINGQLTIGVNKRIVGAGVNTTLYMQSNVKLIDTPNAFKLNNIRVILQATQTETVIKLDANTGSAYQMNQIDLSGLTIQGNNANCVAIHFKCTNGSYMAYNNMHDIAVVAEGVQQACILFEVDNSASFIQGNTFNNMNLIRGGIRYISNGVTNNSTRMIGNYFDGTYQTASGANEIFELSGINNAILWDSAGYSNVRYHPNTMGVNWGNTFFELNGNDNWGTLQSDIFVHDGWAESVEKYRVISTGVSLATLTATSKAQRGKVEVLDPCVNKLDQRFDLVGMSQAGEIISIGDSRRSAIALTNTVALANPSYMMLPFSACTLSKYPEFKIAFRKDIDGFSGGGTPLAWNPRLDAKIGLISDAGNDGIYLRLTGVVGDVQQSTMALCYLVGGVETVLDSSLTLSQDQQCYLSMYVDNDNVYIRATRVGFNAVVGALLAENPSLGATTGWKSVARSALFNVNTMTLNPQFTLTSTDKEIGRAIYHIYGIEFRCTEL